MTLPKTNSLHLKYGGWETQKVILVFRSVYPIYIGALQIKSESTQRWCFHQCVVPRSAMTCLRRLLLGRIKMTWTQHDHQLSRYFTWVGYIHALLCINNLYIRCTLLRKILLGRGLAPWCWVNYDFGLIFLTFLSILQWLYTYDMHFYTCFLHLATRSQAHGIRIPDSCQPGSVKKFRWCNPAFLIFPLGGPSQLGYVVNNHG